MKPVRWGVLSTARIGVEKVIPGMLKSKAVDLVAIASRSLIRAEEAAAHLGIANAYGSYEALLNDPQIEAIYIPLPNHLHVPMTLAAARAGKHVLCEKPMALTAKELEKLRPHASKVHIREAFMVRHHPQWIQTRDLVSQGVIGQLRYIHVAFSYFNDEPQNIRNIAAMGGGAMYDIGCYAVTAGRWFFARDCSRASAIIERDPVFNTDRMTSGLLEFAGAGQLAFTVSTQASRYQRVWLVGTQGRIEIETPFNAPPDAACRYVVDCAQPGGAAGVQVVTVPSADQYMLQAESFSHAVRNESPNEAGIDDAVANARVIDLVFASAAASVRHS
jgi:predicted dehydrogenase